MARKKKNQGKGDFVSAPSKGPLYHSINLSTGKVTKKNPSTAPKRMVAENKRAASEAKKRNEERNKEYRYKKFKERIKEAKKGKHGIKEQIYNQVASMFFSPKEQQNFEKYANEGKIGKALMQGVTYGSLTPIGRMIEKLTGREDKQTIGSVPITAGAAGLALGASALGLGKSAKSFIRPSAREGFVSTFGKSGTEKAFEQGIAKGLAKQFKVAGKAATMIKGGGKAVINAKNISLTKKMLSFLKKPEILIGAIGSYPFAGFLKEEALQTLGFGVKSAIENNDEAGFNRAVQEQEEILNPDTQKRIVEMIPYANVIKTVNDFFKAARTKLEIDKTSFAMKKESGGMTDTDKRFLLKTGYYDAVRAKDYAKANELKQKYEDMFGKI